MHKVSKNYVVNECILQHTRAEEMKERISHGISGLWTTSPLRLSRIRNVIAIKH